MDLFEPVSSGVLAGSLGLAVWLVPAALLCGAGTLLRAPRPSLATWGIGFALVAIAGALRVAFGVFAPWHVNGQGPLWIRGALVPGLLADYGPGYAELFGWLARRSGTAPDIAIFIANTALSALAAGLLFGVARSAGLSTLVAAAPGCLLAADPVLVRAAASETYFVPMVTLLLAAQWLLLVGATAFTRRDWLTTVLASLGAGFFASAVARLHPSAYLPLAVTPLVILAAPCAGSWRTRARFLGLAVLLVAGAVGLTSAQVVGAGLASILHRQASASVTVSAGEVLAALAVAGSLWVLSSRDSRSWLGIAAIASILGVLATRRAFAQHPLWQASYERVWLPGIALGVAGALATGKSRAIAAFALAGGCIAIPAWRLWPYLNGRTTEQSEYRFLRDQITRAPPGCMVAAVRRAGRRTLDVPDYVLPGALLWDIHKPEDFADAVQGEGCVLALRTSICTSVEARSICAGIAAERSLRLVANVQLPAVPSYLGLPYDRPSVEVAAYRNRATGSADRVQDPLAAMSEGSCHLAVSRGNARAFYERLVSLREPDGCRLENLSAEPHRISLDFQTPQGVLRGLHLTPAACRAGTKRVVGSVALTGFESLQHRCRLTFAALERQLVH